MPEFSLNPFRPFHGAKEDAAAIQRELDRLYSMAPQGSVIEDPARRAQLGRDVSRVTELTAVLYGVTAVIPGRAGQLFATYLAGAEKEPDTGRVGPSLGVAGNYAPSPIGFGDPATVGLEHDFYLPVGITRAIPRAADPFIPGLGQARQRDLQSEIRESAARVAGVRLAHEARVRAIYADLSTETDDYLRQVAGLSPPSGPRVGIFALTSGEETRLYAQQIALQILAQRAASANPTPPADGPTTPLPVRIRGGSIQVEKVRPTSGNQIRNADGAEGIRRELVTEHYDP